MSDSLDIRRAWTRAAGAYNELVRYAASRAQAVRELHAWFDETLNAQSLRLVKPDLDALELILKPLEELAVLRLKTELQGCLPKNVVVVPQEFMPMLNHEPIETKKKHYFVAQTLEETFEQVCSTFAKCKAPFSSLQKFNELLNQQFVKMNRRDTLFARPVSDTQKTQTRAALYSVVSTITRVPMLASALHDAVDAALASNSIKSRAADFVACTKQISLELNNCACMLSDLESMTSLCRSFKSTRSVADQKCNNKVCATINAQDLAVVCPNVEKLIKNSTAAVRGGHKRNPSIKRRQTRKQPTKAVQNYTKRKRDSKGRFVAASVKKP